MRFEFKHGYNKPGQFTTSAFEQPLAFRQGFSGVKVALYGDAIAKLFGQQARENLHSEKLNIVNFVPYINILEFGYSKQAPEGILYDPENNTYIRRKFREAMMKLMEEKVVPSQEEVHATMLNTAKEILQWLRNTGPGHVTPVRTGRAASGWEIQS